LLPPAQWLDFRSVRTIRHGKGASVSYFTVRNAVIVALTQVGIIVIGVLAAGACHKWHTTFGVKSPIATEVVAEYGFLALGLPVVWVAAALLALRRSEEREEPEWAAFAFFSGLLALVLLLVGVGYASFGPLFRIMGA
jgi:hypothetical protein